jgi:riboflavin kinase/FMN adenylyltransferase
VRVLRPSNGALAAPDWPRGGVATIGNYDGVHRGQLRVIARVVARARELEAPSVLLTFDPHPLTVLDPPRAPRRLTTDSQRERLLEAAGIDAMIVLPFTVELAAMEADAFVREVLVGRLAVREIHVGSRFAFGRGRRGSLALLSEMGARHGFAARAVEELEMGGEPVSATRVRQAIAAGDVELAGSLLGRPYAIEGHVVAGEQLGRRLGWPTANIAASGALLPAFGVYAAKLALSRGNRIDAGVANVGVRPTRGSDPEPRIEIHLFDFAEEIYGEEVEIAFFRLIREERRFGTLEELSAQIARDAENAREYFSLRGRFEGEPAP